MNRNKYLQLLLVMLVTLLLLPFVDKFMNKEIPLVSFIFLLGLVMTLRAINLPKKIFLISALMALLIFVLEAALKLMPPSSFRLDIALWTWCVYAVFLFGCIVIMMKKLFESRKVTADTIIGGINIYMLLGILWAVVYFLISTVDPVAFNYAGKLGISRIIYFSYNTLTTLGNGDIVPLNRFAMIISSLEAIVGQIYLATFIAILVGLHISHRMAGDR